MEQWKYVRYNEVSLHRGSFPYTEETRFNESLYNEIRSNITNDFPSPSYCKIYGKESRYNETSLKRRHFASPLAFLKSRFLCSEFTPGQKYQAVHCDYANHNQNFILTYHLIPIYFSNRTALYDYYATVNQHGI